MILLTHSHKFCYLSSPITKHIRMCHMIIFTSPFQHTLLIDSKIIAKKNKMKNVFFFFSSSPLFTYFFLSPILSFSLSSFVHCYLRFTGASKFVFNNNSVTRFNPRRYYCTGLPVCCIAFFLK